MPRAVAERGRQARVFGPRYAAIYDAIYADKDYPAECRYLERLFRRHARTPVRTVLSLGCGTGNHDILLARRGFRVTGVDRSPGMLSAYATKFRCHGVEPDTHRGDVRTIRLGKRFDAAIAMFAVLGYQVADHDLRAALETAAAHLQRGAPLVFDVWFGPAVLRDPPHANTKEIRRGDERIVRRAACRNDLLRQAVDIRFTTERWRGGRLLDRIVETHPMRYFFPRELGLALADAGLELVAIRPFGKLVGSPSPLDWTVTVVARRAS